MMSRRSDIKGKDNLEAEKLMYEYLLEEYSEDENKFLTKWYDFYLVDENAAINIFDLMHDYFHYHKVLGEIIDNRDYIETITSEDNYNYPKGKEFFLSLNIANESKLWDIFKDKKNNNVNIKIDTSKITAIKGSMKEFKVFTDSYSLHFSKENINIE